MKCCICKKQIIGNGNNPSGALDEKASIIKWSSRARCCDECNKHYVINGRLALMSGASKETIIGVISNNLVERNHK